MAYDRAKFDLPALCPEGEVDEVGRTLLRMADYIRVHGHCKDRGIDLDGSVCIIGAWTKVRNGWSAFFGTPEAARLERIVGDDIVWWNYTQTASTVISALTRAARAKG